MKRQPGTGTVQFHNGRFRLRLPRTLDPTRAWLPESFRADQEAEAHAFMDTCLHLARQRHDTRQKAEGVTLAKAWPRYVAQVSRTASRRHEGAGAKPRARLEGMGENWLSKAPFWNTGLDGITGSEIQEWLEEVQLTGVSAKGQPLSDSWIAQCAAAIRGVYRLLHRACPEFEVSLEHRKVDSALTLALQERFFQSIVRLPVDRIMAGCQLGAGLRVGELISLTIDDVDLGTAPHVMVRTGGPNGAPTKGNRPRRVELFEPGLGFFRLAVEQHYCPNDRGILFAGPQGGYLTAWAEKFVGWSKTFGSHLTSHDMRHSYALSMLSGLWGYPPQDLTFVSRQLGHQDVRTTQKAYGHWDPGSGLVTARLLRGDAPLLSEPVTAARLLGLACSPGRSPLSFKNPGERVNWVSDGSSTNPPVSPAETPDVARFVVHETAAELRDAILSEDTDPTPMAIRFLRTLGDDPRALRALALVLEQNPLGFRQAVELAREATAQASAGDRSREGAA